MTCKKCGTALPKDALFCTECGQKVNEEINTSNIKQKTIPISTENLKKYSYKLDELISKYGESDILKFTIYAGITFFLSIKILGFLLSAILLTIVNGYLIFSKYRKDKKIDIKLLLLSLLVLSVGIICKMI